VFYAGLAALLVMLFGWFGDVIRESVRGKYNKPGRHLVPHGDGVVHLLRSDVLRRVLRRAVLRAPCSRVPWLGGEGDGVLTNACCGPGFEAAWPTNGPGELGGAFQTIPAWGMPLLNTLILLASGVTITIAHHALKAGSARSAAVLAGATVAARRGVPVLPGLRVRARLPGPQPDLGSGIYGSTFFMLTGFHGMHVTLGAIMLIGDLVPLRQGPLHQGQPLRFEAVAWYWHFVDVVWLGLFLFVYVL
jgi:cytochrome c oxidase subunit III